METGTAPKKAQEIGDVLDDFTLPLATGGTVSLSGALQGKRAAVVVFWSGTCSHCVRYDGWCNAFASKYPDVAFLVLASRKGETMESVQAAIKDRGLNFPLLHDDDGKVALGWFTQQTPRAFLLDPDRKVLYRGAIDNFKYPNDPTYEAYLEPAITATLEGKPVPRAETASFGCAIQSLYYLLPKSL
jgi:peroxiredoxin